MYTKKGVILVGVHEMMWRATCAAITIWANHGEELVITEAVVYRENGGFHPKGRAKDYRVNYFDPHIQRVVRDELAQELGNDYDVILHGDGDSIHIHVEYDPTNPKII